MLTRFRRDNPALFWTAIVHLLLVAPALVGVWIDMRTVSGINPWIKPIKFDLSIAIYVVTMICILQYLDAAFRRTISLRISVCMFAETLVIQMQALRGVKSHFNTASPLDGVLYTVMGIFITYNTWLAIRVLRVYWKNPPLLPRPYLRGIQTGLASLILGSGIGMYLSAQTGHTIGAPDGGPSLPFLNWSRVAGDLRIAHFTALHGLQLFPILGAMLSRVRGGERWVTVAFLLFTCFTVVLFGIALLGKAPCSF